MLKFFASNVVVSKGYKNAPAIKFSETGDFVRFRVGQKVYDPRAEDNHRWINITVKCFDPGIVDRIRKMGLKEGSFINLSGRYDEDVWEDEETKEKRSMPCVILDDLEYSSSGKRSGDGQKANNQNGYAPAPAAAPATPPAVAPAENFQMPGNFTGYESFGGGNNFFNL